MDERLLTRLREAGLGGEVSAQLLHGDAAFALSADELGYVDAAGARMVALKDINRIHSDREGLLRVETLNGTAITASLLGFDPAGVQAFFNQVRTNTNQAKTLPQTAIPQPSANPWKSGWTSSQPSNNQPQPSVTREPEPAAPDQSQAAIPPAPAAVSEPVRPVVISTTPRFNPEGAASKAPAATQPQNQKNSGNQAKAPQPKPANNPPKGEAIPYSRAQGNTPVQEKAAEPNSPRTQDTPQNKPQDKAQDARAKLLQREQAIAKAAEQRGKPAATPAPPRPAQSENRGRNAAGASSGASLQALADSVSGLISTLRLLAVAMGLAAILVGVLRFRENDAVTGLWIIGSGLVAAFALVVFAQVARLLVGIAQRLKQDA